MRGQVKYDPSHLTSDDILKVYNGAHGCMCGCKGSYRVHPKYVKAATIGRGYGYRENEISLRAVKMALTKVQKAEYVWTYAGLEDQLCFIQTEKRQTVLYFVNGLIDKAKAAL